MNVSRPDDDEDPDAARRAADDMDELTLGSPRPHRPRAACGIEPRPCRQRHRGRGAAVAADALLSRVGLSPRRLPRSATARCRPAPAPDDGEDWAPDAADPAPHPPGAAPVRGAAAAARGAARPGSTAASSTWTPWSARAPTSPPARAGSDRVHLDARNRARDLAIAILVDTSFSTDSWVEGRRVLDVEKAALTALAFGLEACGDPFAILTFSSRKRQAVAVATVKGFDERLDAPVRRRIAALRPGAYTRIGAALRHVASAARRAAPSAIACCCCCPTASPTTSTTTRAATPSRTAARRSRRRAARGLAVFAVTVDRRAEGYVPRIFGRGGYAIVGHLGRLPDALPAIYRQLVSLTTATKGRRLDATCDALTAVTRRWPACSAARRTPTATPPRARRSSPSARPATRSRPPRTRSARPCRA